MFSEVDEGGGSPQLYYHDYSGITSQVTPQEPRAPPVGFELELATIGIQFYAIANLEKTSLSHQP